jgi:hypothetical protein
MRRALALLVLAALVAAGCVSPAGDVASLSASPFVDAILTDHEHDDLAAHALWTSSMEMLGHSSLGDDALTFDAFGEMDLHGDLAVVSALERTSGEGAIVLVDLADPADPTRLGWASIRENAHPLDVKFDEAGEFVYASGTGRILVFDVRDPTAPTLAGAATPPGAACHMSAMGVVDGAEYFWCTGDPVGLTTYRVVAQGDQRALVPVAYSRPLYRLEPVTAAGTFGVVGAPHDMTFQLDPVDGTPLLVVSNRGYGLRILDVSDPLAPAELGHWTGEGAEHSPLHFHTGMVTVVNGTRYAIVSPEILPDDATPPAIWILDATDYGAMTLAAEWTAPGDHGSPGFTFTTHQWQVAQERLYLGYYHAGVWVLDLKTILAGAYREDPARPDVLGYYLPHEAPVTEGAMVPNVWDLTLRNGVIYATDISSGVYALHYVPDALGDEAITGFA